jgi:hypothetical protein
VEDQRSINWAMGQKYGQQYANDNRNIMAQWQEAMNQWNNNPLTRSAAPPPQPALYQTDPNQLYSFFNSGQVGIPTTAGVLPYNPGAGPMKQDPYQIMSAAGTPTPVPAGAPGTINNFAPNIPRGGPVVGPQSASTAAGAPGAPLPPGSQPAMTLPQVDAPVAQYPVPPAKPAQIPPYQNVPSSAARPGFNLPAPSGYVTPTQDSDAVASLQPPTSQNYRFNQYSRNMGLPGRNNWTPEAQGGNAPPAPSVSAPSATGRGGGGRTTYNSNSYGQQYRPSSAMAGYYSGGYGGNRRRY